MNRSYRSRLGRAIALSLTVVAALAGVSAVAPSATAADTPTATTPATVTADGLPTWQVNGIVWAQAIVGNTVYVTGNFTKARPPGVAEGGAGEVDAGSVFAYDIRTGNRVTTFNHTLNGTGRSVAASPDGSRVYIGGDFSTVDGKTRSKVVAFNTSDGSLVSSFAPVVAARVSAITVSSTTVYVGGQFTKAGSATRNRLAAFSVADGSLLPWDPGADANVTAMVLAPGGSSVVVGGSFFNLAGAAANGMGAVDATSGASLPWAANQYIRNGGTASSILSLRTDGTDIFGTGFAFGTGNFEGTFSAKPGTGELNWVNDCHGDTYDVAPAGAVVYNVTHAHDCSWIRDFPESNPRSTNQQNVLAMENKASTTNIGPDSYGWNYNGLPAAKVLTWYPDLQVGTISGQGQAGWTISATSQYVAIGGEFPRVNGVDQQSLTRFAVRSLATNKRGPAVASGSPAPSALAVGANTLRVSWPSAYDQDDATLTYQVFRAGTSAPVYTTTATTSFWNHPMMGFKDKDLAAGSYRYTVKVSDPSGNVRTLATTPATSVSSTGLGAYATDVVADGASAFWRLGESSGTAVYDYANYNDAVATTGVVRGAAGAINGDADLASTFDGTSASNVASATTMPATASLSVEAWFKTTTTSGGKIVGYGGSQTGTSGSYDRHIYMTNDGRLVFGLYPGSVRTLQTTKSYNDGAYHQVVGTLDAVNGMVLWVDGKKVATDGGTTGYQDYPGYWRIGGDNLGGWPSQPSSNNFAGTIDDVSVYPTALTKTQVQKHYVDSGRTVDQPPAPTDSYGSAVVADDPALFWRLGDAPGAGSAADSSGSDNPGVITNGGIAFGGPSGVAGTTDGSATFDGRSGTLGSTLSTSNPRVYSEELWFKTTTTTGGKLIGFGSSRTGTSNNYDRHVYMEDSGQLTFGTYTGQLNTTTTSASYNDGRWHHLVATQGANGMVLYVDSAVVGTNAQTSAENYSGYWRVGGDNSWNGRTYFAGSIDDVSVYYRQLSAADVARHYAAGGGQLPNQLPTAAFTSTASDLAASFDAGTSSDPDGTVASYSWAWGDGSAAGSGATASHTYASAGTYQVTLTVTDNRGGTSSVTNPVTVTAPNQLPTAAFVSTVSDLAASFDAGTSSDPDGTVASYSWAWGDGSAAGSGATASHTYASAGTYQVTLTVTDNRGGTNVVTKPVTVQAPNQAPAASFTVSTSALTVSVDGGGSSDPDGSIVAYSWAWGDSSAADAGKTASHTYAAAGTYDVALTVTDNRGATKVATTSVTVKAANQAPTAKFTATTANLAASFDASGSSDPDGSITSYAWTWGDSTAAGSGAKASHTYAVAGTYTVTLTVKDDRGAAATTTAQVTVADAPGTALAQDQFGRAVAAGWGSSDSGLPWLRAGAANLFNVANGLGNIAVNTAGSGPSMTLDKLSTSASDVTVSVGIDKLPVGGTMYVQTRPRQVAGDYYHADLRVSPNGSLVLALMRKVGTTDMQLSAVAVAAAGSYTPGARMNVRVQAVGTGTTSLRAKAWAVGTSEPSTWQTSADDTAASLQVAGTTGLGAYLGSAATNAPIVASFDDLRVVPAG